MPNRYKILTKYCTGLSVLPLPLVVDVRGIGARILPQASVWDSLGTEALWAVASWCGPCQPIKGQYELKFIIQSTEVKNKTVMT